VIAENLIRTTGGGAHRHHLLDIEHGWSACRRWRDDELEPVTDAVTPICQHCLRAAHLEIPRQSKVHARALSLPGMSP
jgi:hypothetical protein